VSDSRKSAASVNPAASIVVASRAANALPSAFARRAASLDRKPLQRAKSAASGAAYMKEGRGAEAPAGPVGGSAGLGAKALAKARAALGAFGASTKWPT
jgi:hypothetical protein